MFGLPQTLISAAISPEGWNLVQTQPRAQKTCCTLIRTNKAPRQAVYPSPWCLAMKCTFY